MKKYKCKLQYDGENYAGFQIQANANTVQAEVEKALSTLFGEQTKIVASGRTDTGVSAKGQIFHFESDTDIPANKIPFALQTLLPCDISVLDCEIAEDDFHARYSAKSKTYSYKICLTQVNLPLYKKYYHYPFKIDINLLKKALDKLCGVHNFKAFMASGSAITNYEREIYNIKLTELEANCYEIKITANGFLYNMVRIIVGLVLDIARGKLPIENIDKMFETGDRSYGGHTAPPEPLILEEVFY